MNLKKTHPISAIVHHKVAKYINSSVSETVIDMGGIKKLKLFTNAEVTNANIKGGIDATNLPYPDDSFDAAVSIATIEHVRTALQEKFLEESIRVARKLVIHWLPLGEWANVVENFKEEIAKKYYHDCLFLDIPIAVKLGFSITPFLTIREHLLLLATIYGDDFNNKQTYDFIDAYGDRPYGYFLIRSEVLASTKKQ